MFDDSSTPVARPADVEAPAPETDAPPRSAALERYHSCRWRKVPDEANPSDFCSHRDVQPIAGTTGFDAEAWCPDCAFYKVRRVPKKKNSDDLGY
jgi:hypothetical protein